MVRIERDFGDMIRRTARGYSPKGTDPDDMYIDILIAVHERVEAGRVDVTDVGAMNNTIRQRAIEHYRKEALLARRFQSVGDVWKEDNRLTYSDQHPTEHQERVRELKARIVATLPTMDARIVCEIAFPSSDARRLAKKRPFRKAKRHANGSFRAIVREWHVAELLGVTMGRVSRAMKAARGKIDEILE